MRHGIFPIPQTSKAQICIYATMVTAMLVCSQCRVCGVDGLGPAGSLNVTFAQKSRNCRVCTSADGGLAMTGVGVDIRGPVPYFWPVNETGTALPGECYEFSKYDELWDDGRAYMRAKLCRDHPLIISSE